MDMEDLRHAIQDSQYLGEKLQQDALKPEKPMLYPTPEQLAEYKEALLKGNSRALSLTEIAIEPIGVFLMDKFCFEPDAGVNAVALAPRALFMHALDTFKKKHADHSVTNVQLLSCATAMWNTFFTEYERKEVQNKQAAQTADFGMKSRSRRMSKLGTYEIKEEEEDRGARRFWVNYAIREYPKERIIASAKAQTKKSPAQVAGEDADKEDLEPTAEQIEKEARAQAHLDEARLQNLVILQTIQAGKRNAVEIMLAEDLQTMLNSLTECAKAELTRVNAILKKSDEESSIPDGIRLSIDLFVKFSDIMGKSLKEVEPKFLASQHITRYLEVMWMAKRTGKEDWFLNLRILGKGGFGQVFAQKKADTGFRFAVKYMAKCRVKKNKAEKLCWAERDCLSQCNSPFLVTCQYAYQSNEYIMLALNLMTGGDLNYWLIVNKKFSTVQTRFHMSEILLGLEYLHDLGYVYRDLKPENCLLDDDGHARISDLGLAVKLVKGKRVRGEAGTPGYMAPEMLRRNENGDYDREKGKSHSYGVTVDMFSYGCMLMQMLCGENIFHCRRITDQYPCEKRSYSFRAATLKHEIDWEEDPLIKDNLLADGDQDKLRARDLIKSLLVKNPKKRATLPQVKAHKWFTSYVDWGQVERQELQPPFAPPLDQIAAYDQADLEASDRGEGKITKLTKEEDEQWAPWSHTNVLAFQDEMVKYYAHCDANGYPEFKKSQSGFCNVL